MQDHFQLPSPLSSKPLSPADAMAHYWDHETNMGIHHLVGSHNYASWAKTIEMIATCKGCFDIITGKTQLLEKPSRAKWLPSIDSGPTHSSNIQEMLRRLLAVREYGLLSHEYERNAALVRSAKVLLLGSVDPPLIDVLDLAAPPADIWRDLKDEFAEGGRRNLAKISREMSELDVERCGSVQAYIMYMEFLGEEYKRVGGPAAEDLIGVKLVAGFAQHYPEPLLAPLPKHYVADPKSGMAQYQALLANMLTIEYVHSESGKESLGSDSDSTFCTRCKVRLGHIAKFCPLTLDDETDSDEEEENSSPKRIKSSPDETDAARDSPLANVPIQSIEE